MDKKTVVIISITSDIGIALANRYAREGYRIVGTYRSKKQLSELAGIKDKHLLYCDISSIKSIKKFAAQYALLGVKWDIFISLPCTPFPIKPFFMSNFNEWSNSVHLNAIEQLRVLHILYKFRKQGKINDVVFTAGGGVNNAVLDFSAYTISKIMLIKMCEFLDAENKGLNFFIVGPGWTRTKVHELTLKKIDKHEKKFSETKEFLKSGKGTSMDDIFGCITWCSRQGKKVSGGRNFSVVNDKWKGPLSEKLANALRSDPNMYKLRRYRNDFPI